MIEILDEVGGIGFLEENIVFGIFWGEYIYFCKWFYINNMISKIFI